MKIKAIALALSAVALSVRYAVDPMLAKGRHGTCPTIQVNMKETGDGPVTINEDDFDPKIHERLDGEEEATGTDFNAMKKADLQAWLDEHEVEYETDANKAALVALCEAKEQELAE